VNATNATTATNATQFQGKTKLGLGITGEIWNDVTGSRSLGTSYTNTYGYPIMISVTTGAASGADGNKQINLYVNGVLVYNFGFYSTTGNNTPGAQAIVPPGQTYSVDNSGSSVTIGLNTWFELY
jgi:hypothetical protein